MRTLGDHLATKPSIDSCINDRVFLADRVRKHVLGWTGRTAYSAACVAMHHTIANAKAQHAAFQLNPPLEADGDLLEELAAAEEIYRSAKQTIRIMAAASVLLEKRVGDRAQEAKKLLDDPNAVFPKALKERLVAMRDGEVTPRRARANADVRVGPADVGALPPF